MFSWGADSSHFLIVSSLLLAVFCLFFAIWALFFAPGKRLGILLKYEASRIFAPFVRVELSCRDYHRRKWLKLRQAAWIALLLLFESIANIFLLCAWGTTLGLMHLAPLGAEHLEAVWLLALAADLFLLLYLIDSEIFLIRYYKRSAYYRQTAVRRDELMAEDANARGWRGEYYVWRMFQALPGQSYCILSPIVPKKRGSFSEIDMVVLSRKGIFAVEAKNRSGTFIKNHYLDRQQQWVHIQTGDRDGKTRIRTVENPFVQNEHHIYSLQNFWKLDRKYFFNIVCFGDLANVGQARQGAHDRLEKSGCLLYFGQEEKLLRQMETLPDILDEALLARLYKEMTAACLVSRQRRETMLRTRTASWKRGRSGKNVGDKRKRSLPAQSRTQKAAPLAKGPMSKPLRQPRKEQPTKSSQKKT